MYRTPCRLVAGLRLDCAAPLPPARPPTAHLSPPPPMACCLLLTWRPVPTTPLCNPPGCTGRCGECPRFPPPPHNLPSVPTAAPHLSRWLHRTRTMLESPPSSPSSPSLAPAAPRLRPPTPRPDSWPLPPSAPPGWRWGRGMRWVNTRSLRFANYIVKCEKRRNAREIESCGSSSYSATRYSYSAKQYSYSNPPQTSSQR